ncbi:MAG: hypothetical protein J6S23_07835 [Clostridia bacterium]|nr:hypothetical protein [Clostridia bacterium]
MNKIYDFCELDEIRARQNKLIVNYVIYVLCFVVAIALACICIKNNILLAAIFFILLLFFALFSIVFWKIKYGLLKKRRLFLDDMESGKREDYVGIFEEMLSSLSDEDDFDTCVFVASNKKTNFLIHKQNRTCFLKGKKYHLLHVGNYVYQWKIIE